MKENIFSVKYFDDTYSVYGNDRPTRGGGVLIATRNAKFSSEQIDIPGAEKLEYVCVRASTISHNIFVYNAYIPPNSPAKIYNSHLVAIQYISTAPNDVVFIANDFNFPKFQWTIADEDQAILFPTAFGPTFSADFIKILYP